MPRLSRLTYKFISRRQVQRTILVVTAQACRLSRDSRDGKEKMFKYLRVTNHSCGLDSPRFQKCQEINLKRRHQWLRELGLAEMPSRPRLAQLGPEGPCRWVRLGLQHGIELSEYAEALRECDDETSAHLGPLGSLAREDEAQLWRARKLLAQGEVTLIEFVSCLLGHESAMPQVAAALAPGSPQDRPRDTRVS